METKKEKILVTGAGGFIGHHLVRFLKKKGYWVRGVDIKYPEFSPKDEADEFLLLDLRDFRNCMEAVKGIDKVYNLACYDEKTEILTENGFKLFKDLRADEKVATLDKDGYLVYQLPTKRFQYNYSGEMFHFEGRFLDFMVTPNHRMYVCRPGHNNFELRRADKCDLVHLRFKRNAKWRGEDRIEFELKQNKSYHYNTKIITNFPIIPFLKFLGYYLSEGSCIKKDKGTYRINIANSDEKVIREIKKTIKDLGYTPLVERSTFRGVSFCSKFLYDYLKQFGKASNKFIPKEIKNLKPRLLNILFKAMMAGDGSKRGREYYTSSKQLADDLQEILLKMGYSATISRKVCDHPNWKDKYVVGISKRGISMICNRPRRVYYSGKVYCVEVPNGIVYVRRNGKAGWCGNSNMGGIGFITSVKADVVRDNVLINVNMAEASRLAGIKRIFFSSSACVYPKYKQKSPKVTPLKESDAYPAEPEDGYGWEKLFSEHMYQKFYEDYGLDIRIARYHNIYGPEGTYEGGREKAPAAICRKVALAKEGDEIEIWGDGEQTRSFCYIDDCLEGTFKLMESDFKGPLNIGSDRLISINALVDLVCKIAGKNLKKRYLLNKPQGVRGRNADLTLTKKVLGWEPKVSLEEGLEKTYYWIKEQLEKSKRIQNQNCP